MIHIISYPTPHLLTDEQEEDRTINDEEESHAVVCMDRSSPVRLQIAQISDQAVNYILRMSSFNLLRQLKSDDHHILYPARS